MPSLYDPTTLALTACSGAVKITLLNNKKGGLADASGALAGRFVTLVLTRSFFGKEDLHSIRSLTPNFRYFSIRWYFGMIFTDIAP
jgi:hypothetical protein